jgi:hypothetical protein
MQLQLYPYLHWILTHDVVRANAAVISVSAAILGICCRNQSSYEDQIQHIEPGKVNLY